MIWFGSILQPFLETQSFTNFVKSALAIYGGYSCPYVLSLFCSHGSMGVRATMYGRQQKNFIPAWNVTRMKRKLKMTVFWEITIESKLLNQFQWSWYHSFQKTMFYLMKLKYTIFSNIRVTKIERSAFLGTPGIVVTSNSPKWYSGTSLRGPWDHEN